ncbi:hypothetical protein QQ020_26340 [Fulvivirgaceae bacterium BMA12]|uniref:Uncharacterized protein n=1 Tax=Agaribacillus aureus TaxID=3051825 RepID=A0ABT8LCX1_9BACT|nr:hypothetical protein [Fulvivirgaceae bacterium BMA12]
MANLETKYDKGNPTHPMDHGIATNMPAGRTPGRAFGYVSGTSYQQLSLSTFTALGNSLTGNNEINDVIL